MATVYNRFLDLSIGIVIFYIFAKDKPIDASKLHKKSGKPQEKPVKKPRLERGALSCPMYGEIPTYFLPPVPARTGSPAGQIHGYPPGP